MIEFELNGKKVSVACDPSARLLDVLRSDFNITGPKEGCGEGECGACSVLLNGRLVNSCIAAMGNVRGASVTTIEGYTATKRFAVLSKAFAEAGAIQCGFCTPGMMLAAEALLSKNSNPTPADVREAISGNICRCTGYNMIIEAILNAAKEGAGLW
jgi:aerobic carbon-monoxide dehydrogenase small subunit